MSLRTVLRWLSRGHHQKTLWPSLTATHDITKPMICSAEARCSYLYHHAQEAHIKVGSNKQITPHSLPSLRLSHGRRPRGALTELVGVSVGFSFIPLISLSSSLGNRRRTLATIFVDTLKLLRFSLNWTLKERRLRLLSVMLGTMGAPILCTFAGFEWVTLNVSGDFWKIICSVRLTLPSDFSKLSDRYRYKMVALKLPL